MYIYIYLVGGDWNHGILNDFPETVGNVIIPTDELIFFRGVGIPPTSSWKGKVASPNDCDGCVNLATYAGLYNPVLHSRHLYRGSLDQTILSLKTYIISTYIYIHIQCLYMYMYCT